VKNIDDIKKTALMVKTAICPNSSATPEFDPVLLRPYLCSVPLGPIERQHVDIAAIRPTGGLQKRLPELVGVVNLEGRPSRGQNVGDEGGNDVRDRLVQERDDRHAHDPNLEGYKSDVFTLGVADSAQG
jgi:hypothetical protein